ncbi:hypothetical protein MA16_Dca024275 [Dendrobium catenatum]|uniref:Uncharacterized protein n=1 Tax=Dendrobium catenatum TaxID=906689 RepID=A0A2I0VIB1_9ASPA|nr:hypothetical protein MA16_Dca024275 [Dendrobium catenatum]
MQHENCCGIIIWIEGGDGKEKERDIRDPGDEDIQRILCRFKQFCFIQKIPVYDEKFPLSLFHLSGVGE